MSHLFLDSGLSNSSFSSYSSVFKIKVLLIEDNPGDRYLIQKMLEEADDPPFELICVNRLSTGLNRLQQENFDVVLLDLSLPDSQGMETIDRLDHHPVKIPIIILTEFSDQSLPLKAMKEGIQDYLVKQELNSHLLIRTIRYAIERHRLLADLDQKIHALQSSEARFRNMIERNADGIIIVDEQGLVCFANPAAEALFGRSAQELLDKPFGFPSVTDETTEIDIIRPDQTIAITEIRVVETTWEGDQTYLVSLRDITARKQLEEQFRQSQKMEAVGRLSGGVAHDFNNLLTALSGYTDLLLHRRPSEQERFHQDIEQIKKVIERAASLTRQLLVFSRKQSVYRGKLNLNHIIRDMEKMLRRLIGEDIELRTVLKSKARLIEADSGQIEQVIMNLVVNARDAMPTGGKLTIETADIYLDESYAQQHLEALPGDYIMMAISDNGHGMDDKTRARIFEPFFTTKDPDKGTGLGLSTVYGIVKQSNGHICVYSEPEQGTTFKIYLPKVSEEVKSTQPKELAAPVPVGSETILLVEDEDVVRNLAIRILRRGGYTVLAASQGAEAIQICQQYQGAIDLLVTDVVMPGGMNGRELAEQLLPQYPALKVLYMSGYTDDVIVRHGILDETLAFLKKPFSPDVLVRKVHQVLNGD
jgi:signal transduction histidine kinase